MNIRRPLNMVPDSLLAAFARIDLAPLWHCVRLGMFFCFPIFEKTHCQTLFVAPLLSAASRLIEASQVALVPVSFTRVAEFASRGRRRINKAARKASSHGYVGTNCALELH